MNRFTRWKYLLLYLAIGVLTFTVSYTMLGQGPGEGDPEPGGNVGDETTPPSNQPVPGGEDNPGGDPGPVAVVNELLMVAHDWDAASVDAIKGLLAEGADPNMVDEYGLTGVHSAILNADMNPVAQQQLDAFLEGGADPNKTTRNGLAPLHMAAGWKGSGSLVASLIRHGANPDLPDPQGKTPLEIALWENNESAISVLKKATGGRPANYDELYQSGKTSRWLWDNLDAARNSEQRWDVVKEWAQRLVEHGYIDEKNVPAFIEELRKRDVFASADRADKAEGDEK